MGSLMAFRAQSDEIILGIVASASPKLGVVDLQIFHGPAGLASPAVALEHSPAELPICNAIQAKWHIFGQASHAA